MVSIKPIFTLFVDNEGKFDIGHHSIVGRSPLCSFYFKLIYIKNQLINGSITVIVLFSLFPEVFSSLHYWLEI